MTTKSALDEIAELNTKIESLKQRAISEIAEKIALRKTELRQLEDEYEQLTGKTVRGEKAVATRRRLTNEQKNALPARIHTLLKHRGEPLSFGQIISSLADDFPPSAVKKALKDPRLFKMTGMRANAQYIAK